MKPKRDFSALKNLNVEKPCHADWNAMTGDEAKRFCQGCQKHVHNLSAMSKEEAAALVGRGESICVRYETDEKGKRFQERPTKSWFAKFRFLQLAAVAVSGFFAFPIQPQKLAESPDHKSPSVVNQPPSNVLMGTPAIQAPVGTRQTNPPVVSTKPSRLRATMGVIATRRPNTASSIQGHPKKEDTVFMGFLSPRQSLAKGTPKKAPKKDSPVRSTMGKIAHRPPTQTPTPQPKKPDSLPKD